MPFVYKPLTFSRFEKHTSFCYGEQTLAHYEGANGRAANSVMHLEDIVKKKDSKALLSVIADSPCSVLKGVTAKVEKTLAEVLNIKTVRWEV